MLMMFSFCWFQVAFGRERLPENVGDTGWRLKLIFLVLQKLVFLWKSGFSFAEIHPPAETSVRLAETRLPSETSF